MWLLINIKPDHNTISRFHKDNPKAIKRVFRASVAMARNIDLIGIVLIAGDSTKLRAQNSKKNNYNKKKIQRHLEYIDQKLKEHNQKLAVNDGDAKEKIQKQIAKHEGRRQKYRKIHKGTSASADALMNNAIGQLGGPVPRTLLRDFPIFP